MRHLSAIENKFGYKFENDDDDGQFFEERNKKKPESFTMIIKLKTLNHRLS